jgi:IS1 family transposase
MAPMNKLTNAKRAQILGMLVEGMSLRSTSRLADVSINTVTKLLVDVGGACARFHDKNVRNVKTTRVECDEIWSFCYSKARNVATAKRQDLAWGDVWTWTAIDADSKLIVSYLIGGRDADYATAFMTDLRSRLANRVQLTTDGHKAYLSAVETAFEWAVDYAQLVKHYGPAPDTGPQRRYSPGECTGVSGNIISGQPDKKLVSTSYVERQNLTLRMGCRRFTRLTNAFSKKIENHGHAVALHMMYYNFGRIHKTLRVTSAMQAGVADRVWSLEEIAALAS